MYSAPANRAGPVLRAGLTEVLVTGMETRWITVRVRPIAIGAKPAGGAGGRRAEDEDKENRSQHEFGQQARQQTVFPWRQVAEAVGGEPARDEARLSGRDDVEEGRGGDRARHLDEDVGRDLGGLASTRDREPDSHGRIEVGA